VRGCGKTTVLDVLQRLALRAQKFDHVTPAIFRLIDEQRPTLLLDECDNLELTKPGPLRSLLNGGHSQQGGFFRYDRGKPRRFSTFAPAAFGAIGALPLPLMHRSIVIHMERAPPSAGLTRFDRESADQMADFDIVYRVLFQWSRGVRLDSDPAMPERLHNRRADNWRVLLAIASACGRGDLAREAAIAISRQHQDEDSTVELLADIRRVFNARNADRLASAEIVGELHAIEDAMWSEWRGSHGNQQPHKITQGELATLLWPFHIKPKSIWPVAPRASAKSRKGYYRRQFEAAWETYCRADDDGDTPAYENDVRHLGRAAGR
jgi:hypothetical protein